MKDTEREKTTAELEAWQLRQNEKSEKEGQLKLRQRGNQNKPKAMTAKQEGGCSAGGKVKLGKSFPVCSDMLLH